MKMVGWCCVDCEKDFCVEKNEESTMMLGNISCSMEI